MIAESLDKTFPQILFQNLVLVIIILPVRIQSFPYCELDGCSQISFFQKALDWLIFWSA